MVAPLQGGIPNFNNIKNLEEFNAFLKNKEIGIGEFGGRRIQSKDGSKTEELALKEVYKKFQELTTTNDFDSSEKTLIIASIISKIKHLQADDGSKNNNISKFLRILTVVKQFFGNLNFNSEKRARILNNVTKMIADPAIDIQKKISDESKEIRKKLQELCTTMDPIAFSENPAVRELKKKNIELGISLIKLNPLVLEIKIESLSQDASFIKKVEEHRKKESLQDLKIFIDKETKKFTNKNDNLFTDDLTPVYEAALRGLKRQNPNEYKKLSTKIPTVDEAKDLHDNALLIAREAIKLN